MSRQATVVRVCLDERQVFECDTLDMDKTSIVAMSDPCDFGLCGFFRRFRFCPPPPPQFEGALDVKYTNAAPRA